MKIEESPKDGVNAPHIESPATSTKISYSVVEEVARIIVSKTQQHNTISAAIYGKYSHTTTHSELVFYARRNFMDPPKHVFVQQYGLAEHLVQSYEKFKGTKSCILMIFLRRSSTNYGGPLHSIKLLGKQ